MSFEYNLLVPGKTLFLLTVVLAGAAAFAQQAGGEKNSQIKINYLNVCSPSETEQQELSAALTHLPARIHFAPDFEISRGRTTMNETPEGLGPVLGGSEVVKENGSPSNWVRIRREFPAESPFISVQYSMSVDAGGIVETLVFRSREAKDVIQVSLEDKVSAGADPTQVVKSDTPVDRVRIERFGKSSVALARCPGADQHAYDALFQQASAILGRYRTALNVRTTVPNDLRRLGVGENTKNPAPKENEAPKAKRAKPEPPAAPVKQPG